MSDMCCIPPSIRYQIVQREGGVCHFQAGRLNEPASERHLLNLPSSPPLPCANLFFSLPINSRSRIRQSDRSDDQGRKLPHEWGNPRSPETRRDISARRGALWCDFFQIQALGSRLLSNDNKPSLVPFSEQSFLICFHPYFNRFHHF